MSSKLSKTYDPNLTLVKNAELAGVSITAVEKYKKRIGVSHRSVRAEFISNAIRTYLKKYPYAKKKEVAKHIGLSVKTVLEYLF